MDRGACGVAKSQTRLSDFTFIVRILLLCISSIDNCPCLRTSVRVVWISSYRILPIKMPQRIKKFVDTFLSVQRLRLHFFYAESMHSISGQGVKIPHATWCSQKIKNSHFFFKFVSSSLKSRNQVLCSVKAKWLSVAFFITLFQTVEECEKNSILLTWLNHFKSHADCLGSILGSHEIFSNLTGTTGANLERSK